MLLLQRTKHCYTRVTSLCVQVDNTKNSGMQAQQHEPAKQQMHSIPVQQSLELDIYVQ